MNKTLKNATVKKYYYRSHQQLKEHLYAFVIITLKDSELSMVLHLLNLYVYSAPDLFTLNSHSGTIQLTLVFLFRSLLVI
ncbi:hypothetical protein Wxf_02985 [Armadillidium vulgare]|nr:hypothetical protein Wxf_02985 [Armadillidium vulgare] [Wolbachia endosymbiont of Armadillidium vulgare]